MTRADVYLVLAIAGTLLVASALGFCAWAWLTPTTGGPM